MSFHCIRQGSCRQRCWCCQSSSSLAWDNKNQMIFNETKCGTSPLACCFHYHFVSPSLEHHQAHSKTQLFVPVSASHSWRSDLLSYEGRLWCFGALQWLKQHQIAIQQQLHDEWWQIESRCECGAKKQEGSTITFSQLSKPSDAR